MALINPQSSARGGPIQFGFKTSIITLFVAIVLFIGLTLVYLSFSRIAAITDWPPVSSWGRSPNCRLTGSARN